MLLVQVARYTFPFVFISAVFWLLHTWILDPVPNKFRRREFIRYRCVGSPQQLHLCSASQPFAVLYMVLLCVQHACCHECSTPSVIACKHLGSLKVVCHKTTAGVRS